MGFGIVDSLCFGWFIRRPLFLPDAVQSRVDGPGIVFPQSLLQFLFSGRHRGPPLTHPVQRPPERPGWNFWQRHRFAGFQGTKIYPLAIAQVHFVPSGYQQMQFHPCSRMPDLPIQANTHTLAYRRVQSKTGRPSYPHYTVGVAHEHIDVMPRVF